MDDSNLKPILVERIPAKGGHHAFVYRIEVPCCHQVYTLTRSHFRRWMNGEIKRCRSCDMEHRKHFKTHSLNFSNKETEAALELQWVTSQWRPTRG